MLLQFKKENLNLLSLNACKTLFLCAPAMILLFKNALHHILQDTLLNIEVRIVNKTLCRHHRENTPGKFIEE